MKKSLKQNLSKLFNHKNNEVLVFQEYYLGYLMTQILDSIERQIQQNNIDYALNSIDKETYNTKSEKLRNQIQAEKERYLEKLSLIYE